jgi:uncharacterized protein YkwD
LAQILAAPALATLAALAEQGLLGEVALGKKKNHHQHHKKHRSSGSQIAAVYAPDAEELAFLSLLNAYRAEQHDGHLSLQHQLGAAAKHHSQDMADNNYVSHTLSNGDSPLKNIERYGYDGFVYWGEVIAAGFETGEQAIHALKTSPEHDKMMRSKHFTQTGIGRAYNAASEYGWYWTITFGDKG